MAGDGDHPPGNANSVLDGALTGSQRSIQSWDSTRSYDRWDSKIMQSSNEMKSWSSSLAMGNIKPKPGHKQGPQLKVLKGSVFRKAAMYSLVPTVFSVIVNLTHSRMPQDLLPDKEHRIYTVFISIIGFVLVFRTSQAYNRFWEGATLLNTVTSTWFDACAQIFVFVQSSGQSAEADNYLDTTIRLFSLLHCAALQQVSVKFDDSFEVVDMEGLDDQRLLGLKGLADRRQRTEDVFKWINRLILDGINDKILGTSAPIVSRCFHELNSGLTALNKMTAITDTPFPVRYTQVIVVLLCIHCGVTPFVIGGLKMHAFWTAVFTYVSIFGLWAINLIASTIEQPFGDDENNFELGELQWEFNNSLLLLVDPKLENMPYTSCADKPSLKWGANPEARLSKNSVSSQKRKSSFAVLQMKSGLNFTRGNFSVGKAESLQVKTAQVKSSAMPMNILQTNSQKTVASPDPVPKPHSGKTGKHRHATVVRDSIISDGSPPLPSQTSTSSSDEVAIPVGVKSEDHRPIEGSMKVEDVEMTSDAYDDRSVHLSSPSRVVAATKHQHLDTSAVQGAFESQMCSVAPGEANYSEHAQGRPGDPSLNDQRKF
eukprot:gnl/MRDRNA2_/MRDRNA2_111537_c0_seq1.p1 gnl/MRDRNA2_/MRDRNA2_111537_c0~~gnl/MRDRNA2_/MRDRNA2_111537_c0_seq1.p1  ORF type:complete len:620 (-),score=93.02 gnl/MRDRNA2_/MRDRNA2_111537_c0_seq1:103-1896(-)